MLAKNTPTKMRRRVRRRAKQPATLAANVTRSVTRILWAGRTFHLRRPIDLTVRRGGLYCFIGFDPIGVTGYGGDEQQALESFADVFASTWDWIAETPDRQLGSDARELKRKLHDLVAEVEPGA